MKKMMQIALVFLGIAGFVLPGSAAEQKIGVFNMRKAFDAYYKTIQSNLQFKQEVADADRERAKMVENGRRHEDEWRKLYDDSNNQAISPEERDKSKQAAAKKYAELEADKQDITEYDRMATARLREKQGLRKDDIVKEIRGVLDAHAKTGGYSLIIDTSGESMNGVPVLLYSNGQDDLTESIVKELNAAAPPGSLDTNALSTVPSIIVTNAPNLK